MFERFTEGARDVVVAAVTLSERAGARTITEEHMLMALFDQKGTRASFAFASLGVSDRRDSVEHALAAARRRAGLSKADTDALAGIGIDVGEILAKVEEAHGEGALSARGSRPESGDGHGAGAKRRWSGGPRLTPGAKGTLQKSLRIAVGRGDRRIGDEHILLALTSGKGVVGEVLAEHGVTYAGVERAVFGG